MLLCAECYAKEEQGQRDIADTKKQEERVRASVQATLDEQARQRIESGISAGFIPIDSVLTLARETDQSIEIITDVFNAKTVALVEVMNAIDADDSIQNKAYAKTEFSVNRIQWLKKAIFENRQQLIEWENELKAHHVHVNELAKKLKEEEREKLKIADITYQPQPTKVTKPRSVATTTTRKVTKKFDKEAAAKAAARADITVEVIRAYMLINPGLNEEQAADKYLEASKKVTN